MLGYVSFGFRGVPLVHNRFVELFSEQAASVPVTGKNCADLSCLEIRIGKIVEIGKHPEAETLFVEKVDLGVS
jgi:tRNA-binding EMAP/Myf-like protein